MMFELGVLEDPIVKIHLLNIKYAWREILQNLLLSYMCRFSLAFKKGSLSILVGR